MHPAIDTAAVSGRPEIVSTDIAIIGAGTRRPHDRQLSGTAGRTRRADRKARPDHRLPARYRPRR